MFKKKFLALLVSLALLASLAVGGTLAYLKDTSGSVTNTFTPAKVETKVDETISGTTKSNVKIYNASNIPAWVRAYVVITWQNDSGEVYGTKPVEDTDYSIDWGKVNWLTGNDGFYYYKNPVPANTSTVDSLIDSISTVGTPPGGYTLHVEIIGSGIQSQPGEAFNAWASNSGLKANDAGNGLEKKN